MNILLTNFPNNRDEDRLGKMKSINVKALKELKDGDIL